MKSEQKDIHEFMYSDKKLYIPVYQRKYDWGKSQCTRLVSDIRKANRFNAGKKHFMGSVVYSRDNTTFSDILSIIDGQQRITTISLVVLALASLLEKDYNDSSTAHTLRNSLIHTQLNYGAHPQKDDIKLQLTKHDRDVYLSLVLGQPLIGLEEHNLIVNYTHIRELLRKEMLTKEDITRALKNLNIIVIELQRPEDDPQVIFESINSTGLDLTESDLIRNFVLMGLPPKEQSHIYDRYWNVIEEELNYDRDIISEFIRVFLTMKTKKVVNKKHTFDEFKIYTSLHDANEDFLSDMVAYAKVYGYLIELKSTKDTRLDRAISNIARLKVSVGYPYLLHILTEYIQNHIPLSHTLECFQLVESYIFRRIICGENILNSQRGILKLLKELNKEDILGSTCRSLGDINSLYAFPTNEVFKESLRKCDIYNMKICRYALQRIEIHNRKEAIDLFSKEYTIDHIMPQSLTEEWRQMLRRGGAKDIESIKNKYVHTIGNLTITKSNAEMGNRPFSEKLRIGYRNSPAWLNESLVNKSVWHVTQINERAQEIVEHCISVWPFPAIEHSMKTNVIGIDQDWKGISPIKMDFCGKTFNVKTTKDIFHCVLLVLSQEYGIEEVFDRIESRIERKVLTQDVGSQSSRLGNSNYYILTPTPVVRRRDTLSMILDLFAEWEDTHMLKITIKE